MLKLMSIDKLRLTEVEVVVLSVADGNEESENLDDGCMHLVSDCFSFLFARHLFTMLP
jgi:hypothetical protein